MGWVERLHEDFSSGLGDLLSNAGNGSIVASGGDLLMSNPNGVDCNWWTTADQNGPSVYRDLGRYRVSGSQIYMVEFYIKEHNKTAGSDESTIIVALERDLANYYLMQNYYANSDYWNIGRIDTDVWVSLYGGDWSGRYRPGWYRLYVHGGERRVLFHERNNNVWLEPGWIGLGFSRERNNFTDDVWMYENTFLTQNYPVDLLNFRIVKKNYGSFPEADATFNDLRVYEWEYDDVQFDGDPNKESERGATRSAGMEDSLDFYTGEDQNVEFPPGHSVTPPHQKDKSPAAASGMEDSHRLDIGAPTVPSQIPHSVLPHQGALVLGESISTPGDRTRRPMSIGMSDAAFGRVKGQVQFRQDTLDPEAHPHFDGLNPYAMYYYRTAGEPWANPTAHNFTGYARDGSHYTNGVQDVGPVLAPWAQEFTSGNRSARDDFPNEALLVATHNELVIFDLDNWPTTLGVWMRFELGPSTYYMIGDNRMDIGAVSMKNGTLVACHYPVSGATAGVVIVNFKVDGTNDAAHLIRAGDHNFWTTGYDIRDRNTGRYTTSGVSPSLRINSEYCYSVDIFDDGSGKAWVAVAGEDWGPQVIGIENEKPAWVGYANGPQDELGVQNNPDGYNTRQVLFDESGWLWYSIENRLYRGVFDYRGGVMIASQRGLHRGVTIQDDLIVSIAQGRNYVYLGTDRGVWRVHKGSLKANLAYTVVGGGGGGLLDNPPDGEVLAGVNPRVNKLHCISTDKSSILQVATVTETGKLGGVTTIRLTDDFVITAQTYDDLPEDRVYVGASSIGV